MPVRNVNSQRLQPNMNVCDESMVLNEARGRKDTPQERRSTRRRQGLSLSGPENLEEALDSTTAANNVNPLSASPQQANGASFAVVKGKRTPKKKRKVLKSKCLEFSCNYQGCGMSFQKDDDLFNHHATSHDRKKPYICHYDNCVKNFTERNKLRRHFLTHTGERPFACTVSGCGKTFSLDFNLRSHMKTHTGEYVACPYAGCKKRYTHKYKLRVHVEKDHEGAAPQLVGKGNNKSKGGKVEVAAKGRKRSGQKKGLTDVGVGVRDTQHGMLQTPAAVTAVRVKREKATPKRRAVYHKGAVAGNGRSAEGVGDEGGASALGDGQEDGKLDEEVLCQLKAKRQRLVHERQVADTERKTLYRAWEEKSREVEQIDRVLAELREEQGRLEGEWHGRSQAGARHTEVEDAWVHVQAQLAMHDEMIHEDEEELIPGACRSDLSQQVCIGYNGQAELEGGECHEDACEVEPVEFQHSNVLFYTADERERKVQEEERFLLRSPKLELMSVHAVKKEQADEGEETENDSFWREEERGEVHGGLLPSWRYTERLNDRYDVERDRSMLISSVLADQHGDSGIKLEHQSFGLAYGAQSVANAAW